MTDRELLDLIYRRLVQVHARWGVSIDPLDPATIDPDYEVHQCGPDAALAFLGDYVLVALPNPPTPGSARKVVRLLHRRLRERGRTRHMVYPLNFPSVKATRKLGAVPVGFDADGFMHYELTLERFLRHGQEIQTPQGA